MSGGANTANSESNRVVREVGEVLQKFDAASDATMEEWALAELLWSALRIHHLDSARRKRAADSGSDPIRLHDCGRFHRPSERCPGGGC